MKNEDTKYSDRAKQVEENVINKSKIVEEFVVSGIDAAQLFVNPSPLSTYCLNGP